MKSILTSLFLALCLGAISARKLHYRPRSWQPHRGDTAMVWKDCVSPGSTVKSVSITPWDSSGDKAVMIHGKNYNVTVVFKATKPAKDAVTHAFGQLGPTPRIEWPLPNPDACGDPIGDLICPLETGKTYTYRKNVAVSTYYPPYQYLVYWELHNEDDEKIFCVTFPLTIKSRFMLDNVLPTHGKQLDDLKNVLPILENKPLYN